MFQDHPETRDYFPKFQDLDSSDKQRNSEEFKDHAEKVVKCSVCMIAIIRITLCCVPSPITPMAIHLHWATLIRVMGGMGRG